MFILSKVFRRSQRLPLGAINAAYAKQDIPLERSSLILDSPSVAFDKSQAFERFYHVPSDFSITRRSLSSKADAKSSGEEDDLEDGFSELESAKSAQDTGSESDIEDDLISEELPGNEDDFEGAEDELDLPDAESGSRKVTRNRPFGLFRAIASVPALSVGSALDKWLEEGNEINRVEIASALLDLRRRRLYGRAWQMFEWLEANKQIELEERDYASRLDLIAKMYGLQKAEAYLEKIPKSFRGEAVYRTLLVNFVARNNLKKAEDLFNKMKNLGFPLSSYVCNQLLLLYKRGYKKKFSDVLSLMEKENVKPCVFMYRTLIRTKGILNDRRGMEQIVEKMKAEGVEPDIRTQFVIAKQYVAVGLEEKAEKVLKEMEGESLTVNRSVCNHLLPVYASLGRADEVDRIWKICKENPSIGECLAAVLAFGKLNKIEEAEEIFEKALKLTYKVSSKVFSVLLRVYVDHKMLSKAKDLIKRMTDSGCTIGPLTWDTLIRLYVEAGEIEKADSLLNKATKQNHMKPLMNSFNVIMEEYAKRGDVHNTEKIFLQRRQAGYVSWFKQFQTLLQAYVNAKTPAYGIRERMKADKVFPDKAMAALLAQADPFKKTPISELLD